MTILPRLLWSLNMLCPLLRHSSPYALPLTCTSACVVVFWLIRLFCFFTALKLNCEMLLQPSYSMSHNTTVMSCICHSAWEMRCVWGKDVGWFQDAKADRDSSKIRGFSVNIIQSNLMSLANYTCLHFMQGLSIMWESSLE